MQLASMQRQQQQHQRQQQQQLQQLSADQANHAVIAGLRTSMAQVSNMASSVSHENKLLVADNKRLLEQKDEQAAAIKQLQVRWVLTLGLTALSQLVCCHAHALCCVRQPSIDGLHLSYQLQC
jgi:thiamine kinase-like enzyme